MTRPRIQKALRILRDDDSAERDPGDQTPLLAAVEADGADDLGDPGALAPLPPDAA